MTLQQKARQAALGYRAGWIDSDIPAERLKKEETGNWNAYKEHHS